MAGDVEYVVSGGRDKSVGKIYDSVNEASAYAMLLLLSTGKARLDVVIHGVEGARKYGGDEAVATYEDDPDASVFERYEFTCNALGKVP